MALTTSRSISLSGQSIINGITIITIKIDDTVVNPIPIRTHFNKVNKNC